MIHHHAPLVAGGIVILCLVLSGGGREKAPKPPPDGSWKVCFGFLALAGAILFAFRRHPVTAAPKPLPPVIAHITTGPSLLTTCLIAVAAAVAIALIGWVVRGFR